MHSFKELATQFETRLKQEMPFPSQPQLLYAPLRDFLDAGGKRIRPILCLMGNELIDDITPDAWFGAKAVEYLHNYTLIHDDIMDAAPLRRGKPTVHQQYGLTAGILGGDALCIYAYDELVKIKTNLAPILSLFNRTAIEVCEGQQMDMDFERRTDVSIDEYIIMITLKTSVLLACSLKMGALIGGSTGGNANKLYEFGKHLGIAFQLQDDYLDAFGDIDKLGKQQGGDIKANKKTYLLLSAQQKANAQQLKQINLLLQSQEPNKIAAMKELYGATGADIACKEAILYYSQLAFAGLQDLAIPQKRKAPLQELAEYLLQRDF
jgi:geranylgeranyl diphosphate synthase, type II